MLWRSDARSGASVVGASDVRELPGVGEKTADALRVVANVRTCADLLDVSRLPKVHEAIGVRVASRLIALLNGADAFACFDTAAPPPPSLAPPQRPQVRQTTLTSALQIERRAPSPKRRRMGLLRVERENAQAAAADDIDPVVFRALPVALQHEVAIEHRVRQPRVPFPLSLAPQTASQLRRERAAARRRRQPLQQQPQFSGADNAKRALLHEWLVGCATSGDCSALLRAFVNEMIARKKLDEIVALMKSARGSPRIAAAAEIVQEEAVKRLGARLAI